MKVTVMVAAHVKYRMPEEACYLPIHVGKAGKDPIGFQGDDTGDHISEKNPYYCELTGLYWMWKNLDSDYLGLVHYRRYLGRSRRGGDPYSRILTEKEILEHMRETEILLPVKRRYYIESVYQHYAHTHYEEHLKETRKVLKERFPDYVEAFDRVMKHRSAHMYNMFVMSRRKCDQYCQWLFCILKQLEGRIDVSGYSEFQARVFGRVAEMLLDVWLEKNQYTYQEVPIVYTEKQNTCKRTYYFLVSKFFGRKYDRSI